MSVQAFCNYINPCATEFHALEDFKKLSCRQKIGILLIVTVVALTIIFAIAVVPLFRFLVGRCSIAQTGNTSAEKLPHHVEEQPQPQVQLVAPSRIPVEKPQQQIPLDQTRRVITGNATAEKFIQHVEGLTQQQAQIFLDRGGILNIITTEKLAQKITLAKTEKVITGCSAGQNRSQVTAAILSQKGISIQGILSGVMMLTPEKSFYDLPPSRVSMFKPSNFKGVFRVNKWDQVGREAIKPYFEKGSSQPDGVKKAQLFYEQYINELKPTHFVTFSESGKAVLEYLLKRPGSLQGFTITHITWTDKIYWVGDCSREAYEAFGKEIEEVFSISN